MTFGFLGQTHIKGDTCRRDVLTWVESNHMNAHGAQISTLMKDCVRSQLFYVAEVMGGTKSKDS